MRESKAIVFSDLELRKLGITRCKLCYDVHWRRYVIDQSVTLRLWVVPRGGGSGMLSVWVEGRSSPNVAQMRGRVWGYFGCEGLQDHHLYSRTNFKWNRATTLIERHQFFWA